MFGSENQHGKIHSLSCGNVTHISPRDSRSISFYNGQSFGEVFGTASSHQKTIIYRLSPTH